MGKIKNNNQGFTLLELLVVVLIIGILAAIALPQYKMAVAKSKFATLKNNVKALYEAEQRYYLLNNHFALSKSGLDIATTNTCKITPCCGSTNSNTYASCSVRISGTLTAYIIWLTNGQKTCLTNEVNNQNDITHRLCQAESGKQTPYCGEGNCQYAWY